MTSFVRRFLFIALLVPAKWSAGQTLLGFEYDPSIPVKVGPDTLDHAWAGGLNYVQFSDIDIDYDGDMDLFVFDRSGDEVVVFTNETSGVESHYQFLPNASRLFPSDVRYRTALVDYNGDGKKDLFTYGIGGIKVYKNTGNASTGVQWTLVSNLLHTDYLGDDNTLYVSSGDIPAIVDVEGDGDIDILTFHISGLYVYYHQNQSMELYGVPDSLVFEVKNECWGHFREDAVNNTVTLNSTDSPCGTGNLPAPERPDEIELMPGKGEAPRRHAGSTILALDINANGVLDLVLGDVSNENLVLLTNGGTAPNTNSAMVSQDINFPSNTTPASMQLFPAGFYVDVNFDGVKDLVVGANAKGISQNETSVSYYENLGANNLPNFLFRSNSFLQGEMIEHGLGSIPVVVDQNGDGKRDLLIADFYRYKDQLDKESTFEVYRNTGTSTSPKFTWYDDDYLGLSSQTLGLRAVPAFTDLDGDNDADMIIGLEDGTLRRYTNSAGAGNALAFGTGTILTDNNGTTIDIGDFASPQLFDLNKDGLSDLIIGKKTGEISYYVNSGTNSTPVFTLANDTLGGIDLSNTTPDGYAIPHFFRVNDTTHLFLGGYDGHLHYYKNIDQHLHSDSIFTLVSDAFLGIDVGLYSSFWVEDLDNDGLLNLFIGQDLGGLHHLEVNPNSTIGLNEQLLPKKQWRVFPNPANESIFLVSAIGNEPRQVKLYTLTGELVLTFAESSEVDIRDLDAGMYILQIESEAGIEVVRFVKQ